MLQIDAELTALLSAADQALGRLDGVATVLPNPDLFVAMYVRQEAVLSSQIEGTQSTLEDVLQFEIDTRGRQFPKDVEEVVNYVRAMNCGLERLRALPLSLRLIREIHDYSSGGNQGAISDGNEEILADPRKLSIWIPILQPMGPALLIQCDNAIALSKQLVTDWLSRYMFRAAADGAARAGRVAHYLSSHATFKSHGRRVKLEHLTREDFGLSLHNLRDDPELYSRIWELYCTLDIIFANTPIYKIFYNSLNDAMIRFAPQAAIELVAQRAVPGPQQPSPPLQ